MHSRVGGLNAKFGASCNNGYIMVMANKGEPFFAGPTRICPPNPNLHLQCRPVELGVGVVISHGW